MQHLKPPQEIEQRAQEVSFAVFSQNYSHGNHLYLHVPRHYYDEMFGTASEPLSSDSALTFRI
jgi:hypothetical protein